MAFDEKKFVGTDALSELSTKVKTELDKKTDKAGALTNISYDTTNKKLTKTTQGAHDPVTTDIVTTSTLKTDMGIADFDGTFNSLKSKPTTISGYGITDAKVQNSTVTIGSNSVTALTQEDVSSTYDSSGTSPVDGKAVAAALGTLDVESVGGAGKYISVISETDGKISATAETMDSTPTSSSTKAVTSDGIYEYVNSSVATNTAYFIGTFDSVEELEAYSGIITNNDYAFVTSTDSSGNTLYNRYKYNGSTHTWSFEYALNNSSFTSAQWATIQSGLTSSDKTKLDGIQSGANKTIVDAAMSPSSTNPVQNKVVNTALAGKQDTLTFDSTPTQSSTNPVTSAGIYTDQVRQDALEAQDRAALIEVVDAGAKNVLNYDVELLRTINNTFSWTSNTAVLNGVSFTLNDDNTISVITDANGATDLTIFYLTLDSQKRAYNGCVLSGCPANGSNTTYELRTATPVKSDYGSGVEITSDTTTNIVIVVRAGLIITTAKVFKPMICTKAAWDVSHQYVPYKQNIVWGLGDKIQQNSDFNSYTEPGVYRVENSTDAVTMLHIPVTTDGGRLEVSIGDTSTEILHTYFSGNAEYRRSYNGSVWSDWVQILSTATLDEIPTANSTNAVMSGGVWTDQQRQETEIGVVANAGAKNLLNVKLAENYRVGQEGSYPITTGNVTFSENGGVIATSGTASATLTLRAPIYLPIGTYYISGSPASGSDTTYRTDLREQGTNVMISSNRDYGSGFEVEITTARTVDWCIRIQSGFDATGLTFSPMIRPAAITDPTFQPFARTNRDLTVLTDEDRASLVELVDGGAKSLLNPEDTVSDKTLRGVTVTRTGDVYSFSGTAEDNSNIFININNDTTINNLPAGDYVAIFEQPQTDIKLQVGINGTITYAGEFGEPLFFTIPSTATSNWIRFFFTRLVNYTGRTGRIMICTKAAWDVSHKYVPYRPSYQELYEMILAL